MTGLLNELPAGHVENASFARDLSSTCVHIRESFH